MNSEFYRIIRGLVVFAVVGLTSCSLDDEGDDERFKMLYNLEEITIDGTTYIHETDCVVDVFCDPGTGIRYKWYGYGYDHKEHNTDDNGDVYYSIPEEGYYYLDKNGNKIVDFYYHLGEECSHFLQYVILSFSKGYWDYKVRVDFAEYYGMDYCPFELKGGKLKLYFNESCKEWCQWAYENEGLIIPQEYELKKEGESYICNVVFETVDGWNKSIRLLYKGYTATEED